MASTTIRLDSEATRRVLIAGLWLKVHDTAKDLGPAAGEVANQDFLSPELPGVPDEYKWLVEKLKGIDAGITALYAANVGDEVDLPVHWQDVAWAVDQVTQTLTEETLGGIPTENITRASEALTAGRALVQEFPMPERDGVPA